MSEKPLERLNYFNGQRLQAGDFKLEQDYHMRVRRWLNRSLYTAGIAMGLEIYPVAGAPKVRVNPGLAIDPMGREIILLDAREVPVMHDIGQGAQLAGSYIVIRYSEDLIAQQDANCSPTSNCVDKTATGGPSRVLADPVIECVPDLPLEASGRILLGRVRLAEGCGSIASIDTSVRDYIAKSSDAFVRQYALEGEREVAAVVAADPAKSTIPMSARVFFHVRGRQPSAVTLILRADQLSPLHYTELGRHTHTADIQGAVLPYTITATDTQHTHDLKDAQGDALVTEVEKEDDTFSDGVTTFGPHQHYLWGREGGVGAATVGAFKGFGIVNTDGAQEVIDNDVDLEVRWGRHRHRLTGAVKINGFEVTHGHTLDATGSSIGDEGCTALLTPALVARTGEVMTLFRDLRIKIDGIDQTEPIKRQISLSHPGAGQTDWMLLGDGSATHPLVLGGSGPIRLDYLPQATFGEGEHVIEFSVSPVDQGHGELTSNGGRILYNLYVE